MSDMMLRIFAEKKLMRELPFRLTDGGEADNGAAFQDAWAYASQLASAQTSNDLVVAKTARWDVILPPGIFKFSNASGAMGLPLNGYPFRVVGANKGLTKVIIPDDEYLWYGNVFQSSLYVTGIHFLGGKGAYRNDWNGQSAGEPRHWRNNRFTMYTECAIAESSKDTPFFRATGNVFAGKPNGVDGHTIGIAIAGAQDGMVITKNQFLKNWINIKIRAGGSSGYIARNDFTRFGGFASNPLSMVKKADIWICPDASTGDGSHANLVIEDCKFGNENWEAGTRKILIAEEDTAVGTGSSNGERYMPKDALSTKYVTGLQIDKCLSGNGGYSYEGSGLVYSYTQYIPDIVVDGCKFNGAFPGNMFVEFAPQVLAAWNYTHRGMSALIRIVPSEDSRTRVNNVANAPVGFVEDPLHLVQHHPWVPAYHHAGSDDDVVEILNPDNLFDAISTTGTKYQIANRYGAQRGAEIRFGLASYNATITLDDSKFIRDRVGWIEFDVKKAAANSLTGFQVLLQFTSPSVSTIEPRNYPVPDAWGRVVIPFISPPPGTGMRINIVPIQWVSQRSGTCTITIADPAVFTWASHALAVGNKVRFTTTGTLPAPLVVGTEYYVESVPSSSTFTISTTLGGPALATTAAGTGTQTSVFVPPPNNDLYTWSSGIRIGIYLARLRIYLAKNPVNNNSIRTLGTGTFDGEHLIMGASHLWIDSAGRLRIKSSAPTTDTDGTIVGAQS